jgi:hydroxypyruvate isomerase
MPKFAANLGFLFTELPFLGRFAAAAKTGFNAIDFIFPYDFDKRQLGDLLAANELAGGHSGTTNRLKLAVPQQ